MKYKPLKGTKDFLPEEARARQMVLDTLKNVFEVFGFQPLETSSIEAWSVLAAKKGGGPEVLEETYNFKDKSGRRVGLIYDLTVPLARVVASHPDLPLPFKRYQVQKVWRYGDVAKGRLREFLQCDIDTVGSESMLADAEIIACAVTALESLGFKDFRVRINDRKILTSLVKQAGVEKGRVMDVLRAVDKLEKIGVEGVREELAKAKIPKSVVGKLLELISVKGGADVLESVEKIVGEDRGISELRELISFLGDMNVSERVEVDLSLARGLDYYTGPIFEISVGEGVGSIAGGGRYDELIGIFSGRYVPATGISFGVERILEVMKSRKMVSMKKTNVRVFVASVGEVKKKVLELVSQLRKNGIQTEFDLKERKLTRQLEYASALAIPYVAIVGEKEVERGVVKLRDMVKRKEVEVKAEDLVKILGKIPLQQSF